MVHEGFKNYKVVSKYYRCSNTFAASEICSSSEVGLVDYDRVPVS